MILAEMAAGTDVAAVVTADASAMEVAVSGPTDVNGVQTWTYTASDNGSDTLVYAASAPRWRAVCAAPGASIQAQKPCSERNVTSSPPCSVLPRRAGFDATVRARLRPQQTCAGDHERRSPRSWSVFSPLAPSYALPTQSASMQYQVKGFPALYLAITVAPLKANAGAFVKVCAPGTTAAPPPRWQVGCRLPRDAHPHQGAKQVIGYAALFSGGGKLPVDCSTINLDRLHGQGRKARSGRGLPAIVR
jgi:hypothetical protein